MIITEMRFVCYRRIALGDRFFYNGTEQHHLTALRDEWYLAQAVYCGMRCIVRIDES